MPQSTLHDNMLGIVKRPMAMVARPEGLNSTRKHFLSRSPGSTLHPEELKRSVDRKRQTRTDLVRRHERRLLCIELQA
eukprot:6456457-Amphidinium_carterae.2